MMRPCRRGASANKTRPRLPHAFTLLELLVAVAVLSILVVMLFGIVDSATRLWRLNENRVDSFRECRAALNVASGDFASMLVTTNSNFFLTNPVLKAGTIVKPPESDSVFFLASLPRDAQEAGANKSDLCAVGYFVGYDKVDAHSHRPPTMNLYRFFRSSDAAFEQFIKRGGLDPSDALTTPGSGEEVVARNVIRLQITPHPTNPPASTNAPAAPAATGWPPELLEITLTAVNDETARKLTKRSDWQNTNAPPLKQNIQQFRIHVAPRRPPPASTSARTPAAP